MENKPLNRSTPKDQPHRTPKQNALANAGRAQIFEQMVQEFAHNAHINRGANMNLHIEHDSDDSFDESDAHEKKSRKRTRARKQEPSLPNKDDLEMGNIFTSDKNKFDLMSNLNSSKLLSLSAKFQLYPDQVVMLEEFVEIMETVMADAVISDKDDFIQQLVDLFYRCKKTSSKTLKFEQLTAYLIDHEIQTTGSGTHGNVDMRYVESDIKDKTTHNSFIEKIYYFASIDKVILYEQNMRLVRIYDARSMRLIKDIPCVGVILAIEHCPNKNAIAVSLSDRTIIFFDTANMTNQTNKIDRHLHVPSTQKCLTYIQRINTLFSAGVDGAIFAWNLEKLFSNEFAEQQAAKAQKNHEKDPENKTSEKEREKREYIMYIAERTPWFVGDIILCLIDLKNINLLASGSYDHQIRLWDLRTSAVKQSKSNKNEVKTKSKKAMMLEAFFDQELPDELTEDFTKQPVKILKGHKKAVREMAYSEKHKIIVSCGFDFEVFVWNPYMEEKIMKLDGHEHPLVGVNCLSQLNAFITADAKGMVKVWSILDYSCIQTFYVQNVKQVTCIRAVPKHRRLICGSRILQVFQYTKPFQHEYSDDAPITCAKFSPQKLEIYVAGERSIKVWDARTGMPVRVLKNVLDSDITYMELDTYHRKLVVGSHQGEVKVFDIVSGVNILTLDSHDPQEGEISFIGYGGADHTIVTCGWDRVIKVHLDEVYDYSMPQEGGLQPSKPEKANQAKRSSINKAPKPNRVVGGADRFQNPDNLLRGRIEAHSKDIICGDLAMHLDLLATGSRDNKVRIWDYERIMSLDEAPDQGPAMAHTSEVTIVRFVPPFPLLITTDISGQLYIWLTKPHKEAGVCLISWRNAFTLKKNCPITAIDTYYDNDKFLLLIGDEMGNVRVQDISAILKQMQTMPIKPCDTKDFKRNPYRLIEMKQQRGEQQAQQQNLGCWGAIQDEETETIRTRHSIINEAEILQIAQWTAHSDVVRSIQYISVTDEPLVLTASLDKFVKIFSVDGTPRGTLQQGYMMQPGYQWEFPMQVYDAQLSKRNEDVNGMLQEQRNDKDNVKRKLKVEQNIKQASQQVTDKSWLNTMSSGTTRNHKTSLMHSLLEKGHLQIEVEQYKAMLTMQKQKTNFGVTPKALPRISFEQFQSQQKDLRQRAYESQQRQIGPFNFSYDDDIESEVLNPDQVYRDLKDLDDILNRNQKNKGLLKH